MKKIKFTLFAAGGELNLKLLCGLLVLSLAAATQVWAKCPSDMSAYLKLEEDAAGQQFSGYVDASGNSNAGLCTGTCPTLNAAGAVDGGQDFDTSNGIYMAADTTFDFSGQDNFSVELWFKRQTVSSREVLIGRYSQSDSMNWWLGIEASGRMAFALTSVDGVSGYIVGQKTITNDVWHHVAAVRINGQNRLYVDGKLDGSKAVAYPNGFASTEPLTVGYLDNQMPAYPFGGLIDEVAVYNTALSPQDIQMHYYLSRAYCETHDQPVEIMPMGDSITYDNRVGDSYPYEPGDPGRSEGERTGYRWPLRTWLGNASYWVDFVGNRDSGGDIFNDSQHAGFPGINAAELYEVLRSGFNAREPDPDKKYETPGEYLTYYPTTDVILLHIGTNDVQPVADDVVDILDQIDAFSQKITVVLAQIINRVPVNGTTSQFNGDLFDKAQDRIAEGDKIILVDMENDAGIIYQLESNGGDMHDTLHPSNVTDPTTIDSGYGKMADVWYQSLEGFLPQSSPPVITSSPIEYVNSGDVYIYEVEADGNPLTFSLTDAPPGMIIDSATGKIEWTPAPDDTPSDFIVTVSNWLGTVTQPVTVSLNSEPVITSDIPDQSIEQQDSFAVIQLDDYVDDPENADAEIAWSVTGNNVLAVDISERKATITVLDANWSGSETITFRATDPAGLFDEDAAVFTVKSVNKSNNSSGGGSGCFINTMTGN